ncbi:MAG: hypothetical protein AVW06_02410 [Hadesarchaea archaeon DG-33-1]|nr:MAG: hypothetical protein AVW06_02410 [Hadesarchaea archaeon DG-33-1]
MQDYDLIVVGAGPAGLAAARSAAKGGAEPLLIEKNPEIAAVKPCGEGVSQATFKTAEISPKPSIVLHRTNAQVYAPNMKCVEIKETGFSINKTMFLQEMAIKAVEAGARIKVGEVVQHVEAKDNSISIKTARDTYRAHVVIGADGYLSAVAKSLGVKEKSEPIPCVQYRMINCKLEFPDSARVYLGNEIAPRGYAWIFPKSDGVANVGIGVRGAQAKPYLDKFIEKLGKEFERAQVIDYRGAVVPIGGLIKQNVLDGAILVGDAAGMVIPFTGAGIHSSIAAGLMAGEVAARAVAEKDTSKKRLLEFRSKYDEHWGGRIGKSLKAMRAIEKLNDADLNLLQETLTAEDILNLANGVNVKRVALKLLKHPVLAAKLAKALI